jgi:hypothetical protein
MNMNEKEYKAVITGVTPLLQNKIDKDVFETDVSKKTAGAKHDSPEACPKKLYLGSNNKTVCQPAEMVMRALCRAATAFTVPGAGKKTYADLVAGAVIITPFMIPHKNQKWVVDERTTVIKATRGRVLRFRPRFDEWSLEFTVSVGDPRINETVLKQIFEEAGKFCGIGDGRKIGMGRFKLTIFAEK